MEGVPLMIFFLSIIIVYNRGEHQSLLSHMSRSAVREPKQETAISTHLISTVAQWKVCHPKVHGDFNGAPYSVCFKTQRVTD